MFRPEVGSHPGSAKISYPQGCHLPFRRSRQAFTSSSPRTASSTGTTGCTWNTKAGSMPSTDQTPRVPALGISYSIGEPCGRSKQLILYFISSPLFKVGLTHDDRLGLLSSGYLHPPRKALTREHALANVPIRTFLREGWRHMVTYRRDKNDATNKRSRVYSSRRYRTTLYQVEI
jgi:hypothetical protein